MKEDSSVNVPVGIGLSDIALERYELLHEGRPIIFQIDSSAKKLWFVHRADGSRIYHIKANGTTSAVADNISVTKAAGDLRLLLGRNLLLTYRYGMNIPPIAKIFGESDVPIPETEVPLDSIFKKSGYLHPLLTPKGDTLSRINPIDHLHHYGMWGPWTHTRIDTTRVDFWNLGEGMGTVSFKEFAGTESGPVYGGFQAVQEHIDLKTDDAPQVALNENLEVRLWKLNRPDRYMFDYTTTFSSALENGILFEAYRYGGGIGMRFKEGWKADNCSVLTSEGKDRLEADGTNARWCIVSGASSDGKGTNGILFMSHPENRMHPEPMRVWPIDANGGRGDMFFEFCPIRHEEWKIEPNQDYKLNYRMVVFDGMLGPDEAEAYWQAFAHPVEVNLVQDRE